MKKAGGEGMVEKVEKGGTTEKADNQGRINEAGWRR